MLKRLQMTEEEYLKEINDCKENMEKGLKCVLQNLSALTIHIGDNWVVEELNDTIEDLSELQKETLSKFEKNI